MQRRVPAAVCRPRVGGVGGAGGTGNGGGVAEGLAEVDPRGRLGAVGSVAEVDGVEVLLEDLGPGPLAREVIGQRRLAQLLEHGAVAFGGQGVLDELLGDRRCALASAAGDVGDKRAGDAPDVHAGVRPEPLVLDGDDRLAHVRSKLAEGVDHLVVGRLEDADLAPVVVVQVGVRAEVLVLGPVLDLGQVGRDRHHHPEDRRDDGQGAEAEEDPEQAQLADLGLAPAAVPTAPQPSLGRRERDRSSGVRRLADVVVVVAHAIEAGAGGRPWQWRCGGGGEPSVTLGRAGLPRRRRESSIGLHAA